MRRVIVFLVLVLLAFSIMGCDEDIAAKPSGAGAGEAGEMEELDEGSAEVGVEEESEGSFVDKFKDFAAKKINLEYTISYDFTAEGMGETNTYTMTQYYGGKNRLRMDSKIQGQEARIFMLSSGIYSCNKASGAWQCLKFGSMEETQDSTEQFRMVEENPEKYNIHYDGTKRIAGTTAHCYKITVAGAQLKECFSKEGVPLYMLMKGNGFESEMEATTYKTSVKSSDFTLPAEPMDVQDMIQQAMPEGYEMPEMDY